MAAKKKKKDKRKKTKAESLRDDLKATAQKVWLAGLGALAVAEEEGSRVFKTLVDKGEDFERRSRPRVQKLREAAKDAADTAKDRVEKVADTVGETAGKVGDAIDDKITAALHRFGIPTKREIDDLSASVAALTEKLDGVKRRKATKRKATKRKATKRKATKRKATKRKPAQRKAAQKSTRKTSSKRAASKKTTG